MILYNLTVNVDESIHNEWLEWIKTKHIPDVLSTGLFTENKMYKIFSEEEDEGYTYSIQYLLNTLNDYEKYQKEFAPRLQSEHSEKFRDKIVSFRTIMESVE